MRIAAYFHQDNMQSFVLLSCLLCFCGLSLSQECVRELQENMDFPGDDVLQVYSPDVKHCQLACTQHSSCQFFTFVRPDWTLDSRDFICYLKHTSSGQPKVMKVLLGLTSGFSLKGCVSTPECVRELQENMDFPGDDVLQVYSPDVKHCQLACTQHSSCQFFTFVRPDWTLDSRNFFCYLKHTSSGQPKVKKALLGVTSGFSLKGCVSPPAPPPRKYFEHPWSDICLSEVYHNVDFTGADFRSLFTVDYEECQRACTDDPGCQFFSFVTELFSTENIRYKCHLKFSWSIPRPQKVTRLDGVVSGFSQRLQIAQGIEPVCQAKIFPNVSIEGGNVEEVPAASAEHCQHLCSNHPRCTFFTFDNIKYRRESENKEKIRCQLKHDTSKMVTLAKEEMHSGIAARFCSPTDWVTAEYEAVDFLGYDRTFVKLDDKTACQQYCTEEPQCQFYTYVYDSFHDAAYRRRCYLKQVMTLPLPPKVVSMANVVSGFARRNC